MSKWVNDETDNWELLNRGTGTAGQGKQAMGNEVPILTTRTGEVWSLTATPGTVELIAPANYKGTITVFGINVGTPDDLAALVRDARRFRKLVRFSDGKWGTTFNGMPLEQLADALPEVES